MRFGMMGMVTMFAVATAGMAHGERENRGLSPNIPNIPQKGETGKVAGSCIVIPKDLEEGFLPDFVAQQYYSAYEHRDIGKIPPSNIRVLRAPKHGTLTFAEFSPVSGDPHYIYRPANGFVGKDTAEFLVTVGQESLRVVQTVVVFDNGSFGENEKKFCAQGGVWKISFSTVTTPTLDNLALQSLLDATGINSTVTANKRGQATVSRVSEAYRRG